MLKIGYLAGMQTQAPRLVLAEAAMDALFLSYAVPDLAAEVILGHFESAPHPNLPCIREDGSYNMVADDGQICGTAKAGQSTAAPGRAVKTSPPALARSRQMAPSSSTCVRLICRPASHRARPFWLPGPQYSRRRTPMKCFPIPIQLTWPTGA
jgi:hypothetical protein